MKIDSSTGFRPLEKPTRRNKPEGAGRFTDAMNQVPSGKENKATEISSVNTLNRPEAAPLNLGKPGAVANTDALVRRVLDAPETARTRVKEVQELISQGGIQAYFDTVDSEKVAERLLDSGVLDDMI